MASSRNNILTNLQSTLEGISSIKTVIIKKSSMTDLDVISLPAIFIYIGPEEKVFDQRAIIGYETWDWKITLAVYARDTDMEELLKDIHDVLFASRTLTNTCIDIIRQSADELMVDVEDSLKILILDYSVLYRHTIGVS